MEEEIIVELTSPEAFIDARGQPMLLDYFPFGALVRRNPLSRSRAKIFTLLSERLDPGSESSLGSLFVLKGVHWCESIAQTGFMVSNGSAIPRESHGPPQGKETRSAPVHQPGPD